MEYRTYLTKGGNIYIPEFVVSIDPQKCIGCGRCYKVCPQSVLSLYQSEDDDEKVYMTIVNEGNCIGCKACAKSCPKGCFIHKPLTKEGLII